MFMTASQGPGHSPRSPKIVRVAKKKSDSKVSMGRFPKLTKK